MAHICGLGYILEPLYRLEDFAENHDTGLLLGRELDSSSLNDTSVGRAIIRFYHEFQTIWLSMDLNQMRLSTLQILPW
jgi:hypothetical protein